MEINEKSEKYELSGGGEVSIFKPFGDEIYAALTNMSGDYPDAGQIARNYGRDELVVVLEGSFEVTRNGESKKVAAGETITIPDGTRYKIRGTGRSLVLVKDVKGGSTVVEPEFEMRR